MIHLWKGINQERNGIQENQRSIKKREEKKFQDIGQEKFQDDSCVADLERYQIRWGQENQGLQEEALEIFFFNFKGTGTDNENVY